MPHPATPWRSSYDQRDRLLSLVQAHPNFAAGGAFPNPIRRDDPTTVNAATAVDVAFVVPGQNIGGYSLGPNGVGKLLLTGQVMVLIYVANTPVDPATPELWLAQKQQQNIVLGQLTALMLQAVFAFPVDPTPGDQLWNVLELVPAGLGLHTTFYETDVFHQSKTRVSLRGQMYRPGGPNGRPSL